MPTTSAPPVSASTSPAATRRCCWTPTPVICAATSVRSWTTCGAPSRSASVARIREPVEHELFDDDPAWDLPEAAQHRDHGARPARHHRFREPLRRPVRRRGGPRLGGGALRLARPRTQAGQPLHPRRRRPRRHPRRSRAARHRQRPGAALSGVHAARRPLRLCRPRLGVRPRGAAARRHHPGRGPQPPQLRLARTPLRPRPVGGAQGRHAGLPRATRLHRRLHGRHLGDRRGHRRRGKPPHAAFHGARRGAGDVAAACRGQAPPAGAAAWSRSPRAKSAAR